jgi:MFS family permease
MTGFCFIHFAANAAIMCAALFIPFMARDYGATPATIGLLVALYNGMYFVSSIISGRWADLKGAKALILVGLLLSSIAFFLHSHVSSIQSLFLVRCLAGFAVGMYPAALLAHVYGKKLNLGIFTASGSLGWGLGSVIAGIIAVYQNLFLFSAICFFLAFIVAAVSLKQEPTRIRQRFFDTSVLRRNWRLYLAFFLRHCGPRHQSPVSVPVHAFRSQNPQFQIDLPRALLLGHDFHGIQYLQDLSAIDPISDPSGVFLVLPLSGFHQTLDGTKRGAINLGRHLSLAFQPGRHCWRSDRWVHSHIGVSYGNDHSSALHVGRISCVSREAGKRLKTED